MTRTSMDMIDCQGITFNGYDYSLQVWVKDYHVEPCSHPLDMRRQVCCNQMRFAGLDIRQIPGHSVRCPGCGGPAHGGLCQ